ncbi:MAG: hypothetical protein IJQ57_02920, partial [Synergistaceae bacterium]|nr:hypothetical protein [Synergistaceae bacterium]
AICRVKSFKHRCKKKLNATDRKFTTALYLLRAKQLGLTLNELEELDEGFVIDMITESSNDSAKYHTLAGQSDFDNF